MRGGTRDWPACDGSGKEPASITFTPDPPMAYAYEGVCGECGRVIRLVKAKQGTTGFKVVRHGVKQ